MDVFVNSKPFEDVFEQYIQKNAKVKIAEELNRRAANIIMEAMRVTTKVDPDTIADDLGAYYAPIKRIIRHKVSKAKWRLKTKSGKEVISYYNALQLADSPLWSNSEGEKLWN